MLLRRVLIAVAVFVLPLMLTSAVGASRVTSTYVALGDSYSSGAGLGPFVGGPPSCERSARAYPALVARSLTRTRFDFVACSGATIAQIVQQVVEARGFLREARLVTLTAGGNDLPFGRLLAACLGFVTSSASSNVQYLVETTNCSTALSNAASLLGASVDATTGRLVVPSRFLSPALATFSPLESRLVDLVRLIERESVKGNSGASARVLVVSYPVLLGNLNSNNCRVSATPFTFVTAPPRYPVFSATNARTLLAVNELLRRETASVVSTLARSSARVSLVNASSFVPLNCATGVSNELNGLSAVSLKSGGSFHPTAYGQVVLARAVLDSWERRR